MTLIQYYYTGGLAASSSVVLPPIVSNPLVDQSAEANSLFTYIFAANTFSDPQDLPLTYTATLSNGNPLPAWLNFRAEQREFEGTPAEVDEGTITIRVTASNGTESVTDDFTILVEVVVVENQPPVVSGSISNQTAQVDSIYVYQVPSSVITDPEGATLVWSATQDDDSPLPAWLSFDPSTRIFSGTPSALDEGNFSIKVTATDPEGLFVSITFSLLVAVAQSLDGKQPFSSLLFGRQEQTNLVRGHKFWCWDEPHGLADSNPNIHRINRAKITERAETRWKANLPGLGPVASTADRYPDCTTGPLTVTIPQRMAQDFAARVIIRGLNRGEIGILLQNFGSPFFSQSFPFINQLWRSVLDAPNAFFTDGQAPVVVDNGPGTIPTIATLPGTYTSSSDGIDSLFTRNGVDYWSGWITAFCTEWKRLQAEDPYYEGLPDPTAFWMDTENQLRGNNILKFWSRMLEDPRATDINAIAGVGKTLLQIHLEIRSRLAPEDRLPEAGEAHLTDTPGVVLDTTSYQWASSRYAAWSEVYLEYQQLVEISAARIVMDDEIKPFFPTAYIGNWNTTSGLNQVQRNLVAEGPNSGIIPITTSHGSHHTFVFYGGDLNTMEYWLGLDSAKPYAPWLIGPLWFNFNLSGEYLEHAFWTVKEGEEFPMPAELQTKYADLLSGDIHEQRLGLVEIYIREAYGKLRDAGCRNFLLWWNQENEDGIAGTPVGQKDAMGDLLSNLYDTLFSDIPTVPLAKYLHPSITSVATGIPKSKLRNGIKSWSLQMADNGDCVLYINRRTYIGTYAYPEQALQVIVALHIRLGASASTEEEQRALKALIDSKYVSEIQ